MNLTKQTTAGPFADESSTVKNANRSPRIKHAAWGRLDVEGKAEPYKDAKLFRAVHASGIGAKRTQSTFQVSKLPMFRSCWSMAPKWSSYHAA